MTVEVRVATAQDVEPLSRVLARAFRADPLHRWIFPDERHRERHSHRCFALALREEVDHGTVFTTEAMRGVAIWRGPARGPHAFREQLRVALPMTALLGWRSAVVFRGFQRLMAHRPREAHWYLGVLGTEPADRENGIGSALVREVLTRCDHGGEAAYLEASAPEVVPFYERHGFAVVGELALPAGPPVWRMSRAPRA